MSRWVVDTNVPIVANGRSSDGRIPCLNCKGSAVEFLMKIYEKGTLVVDFQREIFSEYQARLNPSGQPGVGDRFLQFALNTQGTRTELIDLQKDESGDFCDLPQDIVDAGFDPSDRKFAALSAKERIPVVNAVDSDWIEHREVLQRNGVQIRFLCGEDIEAWFE